MWEITEMRVRKSFENRVRSRVRRLTMTQEAFVNNLTIKATRDAIGWNGFVVNFGHQRPSKKSGNWLVFRYIYIYSKYCLILMYCGLFYTNRSTCRLDASNFWWTCLFFQSPQDLPFPPTRNNHVILLNKQSSQPSFWLRPPLSGTDHS